MKWFTTPRRNSSSITDPEPLLIKIGPLTNQSDKTKQQHTVSFNIIYYSNFTKFLSKNKNEKSLDNNTHVYLFVYKLLHFLKIFRTVIPMRTKRKNPTKPHKLLQVKDTIIFIYFAIFKLLPW